MRGTTPSVIRVDFTGVTPVFSAPIPVAAATSALLSGGNLYVAGTPAPALLALALLVAFPVRHAANHQYRTLTASAPVPITGRPASDMALTSTNKLYIGIQRL